MTVRYQHTQIGYLIMVAFLLAAIFIAFRLAAEEFNWVPVIVLALMGVALLTFSTLTVKITGDALQIRLGAGLLSRKFLLSSIESCRVVRNPWYYGWGIRLTPDGLLYNVSGFNAVAIRLHNGKKYRIGTDEPQKLESALREVTHCA